MSVANKWGLPPGSAPCPAPHGPYPGLHQSPGGVASGLWVGLSESLGPQLHLPGSDGIQLLERVVPCGGGERVNLGGKRVNPGSSPVGKGLILGVVQWGKG